MRICAARQVYVQQESLDAHDNNSYSNSDDNDNDNSNRNKKNDDNSNSYDSNPIMH